MELVRERMTCMRLTYGYPTANNGNIQVRSHHEFFCSSDSEAPLFKYLDRDSTRIINAEM
jgi:hypothetical protein